MRYLLIILLLAASPARADLIFKTTMDDAAAITSPAVGSGGTIVSASEITYVAGQYDTAAKINNDNGDVDGPITFPAENFDFNDPDHDGGRLDIWLRFDQNPHTYTSNAWIARTNWPTRRINWEMTKSGTGGDPMLDVYGEIAHSTRTNYEKFRVNPRSQTEWEGVATSEWHVYTFLWRNNRGIHQDEIHYYIDGELQGSDYNGNLPIASQLTDFQLCPRLSGNEIDVTFDEIYAFDSWDMDGVPAGNYATLNRPEGVFLKYPQDKDSPTWGSPHYGAYLEFAFEVLTDSSATTECDIYLEGEVVGTVTATSEAYTEWLLPTPKIGSQPTQDWQVKCDSDRLVSDTWQFQINHSQNRTIQLDFDSIPEYVPGVTFYRADSVMVRWAMTDTVTSMTDGALYLRSALNGSTSGTTLIKGVPSNQISAYRMAHKGTIFGQFQIYESDWTAGVVDTTITQ